MTGRLPTIAEEDRERERQKKDRHKSEVEQLHTQLMQFERDFQSLNDEKEKLQKQLRELTEIVKKAQQTLSGVK